MINKKIKKNKTGRPAGNKETIRPSMTQDEYKEWTAYKEAKAGEHTGLDSFCKDNGIALQDVNSYWRKDAEFSVNVKIKKDASNTIKSLIDNHINKVSKLAPKKKFKKDVNGQHILVINPADVHFGKLAVASETGGEYNLNTATKRITEGVLELFTRATSTYDIKQVVFIGGNDMLHIDNPGRKTTAGTPQDTSGQWFEAYTKAWEACTSLIEYMTKTVNVHYIHCPSNHDYLSGFHLSQTISAYFTKNNRVTCDVSNSHRKYVAFGNVLIGATHGDGAKEADLPSLMANEARSAWSTANHKYWLCGHLHHKIKKIYSGSKAGIQVEKDYSDVTVIQSGVSTEGKDKVHVEYLRCPSESDSWHSRNGYTGGQKALEAFVFHEILGERARLTVNF